MGIQIIAEAGINHNGDINIAKKLIDIASVAGCDYVKFQKRTPDLCVPECQKNKEKIVPWHNKPITYLQYKKDIEFGKKEYQELILYSKQKSIKLFTSVWDIPSANFMKEFNTDLIKIPSACLTSWKLLEYIRQNFNKVILSTGMSTEQEIKEAVKIGNPDIIFHTNSVYPTPIDDLNMGYIKWLQNLYPNKEIGFSSHYYGIVPAIASVYLEVKWIEIHITLDHAMWGSDQLSSVEPSGLFKLVKGIRDLEKTLKGNKPRKLFFGEEKKRKSLRKYV